MLRANQMGDPPGNAMVFEYGYSNHKLYIFETMITELRMQTGIN